MPYYYPDTENPGWTRVSYMNPESDRERAMRLFLRRKRYEAVQERLTDPVSAYLYNKEQELISATKRAMKQANNWHKTEDSVMKEIQMRMGADAMPTIIQGGGSARQIQQVKGERKVLKNRRYGGPSARQQKLLEEDETAVIKEFDREFINLVKFKRQQDHISQAKFGEMVNLTLADVRAFERGELPYDSSLKSMIVWKLEL